MSVEGASQFVGHYLAGANPRTFTSPLYGDSAGLPPTIIQVGSDEVRRDDAVRMADGMRAAGCQVELEIWVTHAACMALVRAGDSGSAPVDRLDRGVRAVQDKL